MLWALSLTAISARPFAVRLSVVEVGMLVDRSDVRSKLEEGVHASSGVEPVVGVVYSTASRIILTASVEPSIGSRLVDIEASISWSKAD